MTYSFSSLNLEIYSIDCFCPVEHLFVFNCGKKDALSGYLSFYKNALVAGIFASIIRKSQQTKNLWKRFSSIEFVLIFEERTMHRCVT